MDVTLVNPIAVTPDLSGPSLVRSATATVRLPPDALREINIVELGQAIADLGHRVRVVVGTPYAGRDEVSIGENVTVVPVRTVMPFPFHPGLFPMTPGLLRNRAVRDVDVIQSSEFHQPSTLFAAAASLELGIPLVLWQETFVPMQFPGSIYQRGFELACGPKVRAAATRCIPRTTKATAYLRSLGVDQRAIPGWIPTGIDLTRFAPQAPRTSVEEFGWGEGSEVLLLVARLSPSKGVDRALRMLKRLLGRRRGLRLLLRGTGPEEAELRQLANRLGLSEHVRFVPKLTRDQMVALYNLADVVLSTSRADLLPFALLEASACGRAIVASDVGAVSDIVQDGETGLLVRPDDESGLCDAVERMLRDPDLRLRCGRAARARAESNFDLRATAKRLVGVYHAAAG